MNRPDAFEHEIWILAGNSISFHGVPFTTRSIIIRLPSGKLWVHSPVDPAPELNSPICELGTIAYLIAPNKIHSIGVPLWQTQWPDAQTWISPGFHKRHPEIPYSAVLTNTTPDGWEGVIDQHIFAGNPFLDEVLFLHKPSKTLIVTDLIQKHVTPGEAWYWRFLKSIVGIQGKDGGTARDIRLSMRDRKAAQESRDYILSWDFERLILSHGLCLHTGAKLEVQRALAWLK